MNENERRRLLGFYGNELINHLLYFWLGRCEDKENESFFSCFDDTGSHLMSKDKYIWSQGRFVWIFVSLATMRAATFSELQKKEFKRLARQGRDFLYKHCLIAENDYQCVYLTDEAGRHKLADGCDVLDPSIYADCFVINVFAKVAWMGSDMETREFAKRLYRSVRRRLRVGTYCTLPYPMGHEYRAHGIPMIMTNIVKELYDAALVLEPSWCGELKEELSKDVCDTLEHFIDGNHMIREVIRSDNTYIGNLFGTYVNPGHAIENMWFILDVMEISEDLNTPALLEETCMITKKALETGWDKEHGGLFHYASLTSGPLTGDTGELEEELVIIYARRNCMGKIWWAHSEALYTTLRLYLETGEKEFWDWYKRIEAYVFQHFPNPDSEIREWIQTPDQFGHPKKEAVELPIKDPYHIMRNVLLFIGLLNK